MDDLLKLNEFLTNYPGDTAAVVTAGLKLARQLSHNDTKGGTNSAPAAILTGIPTADYAITQAAGVAEIAGRYGVDVTDVISFAKLALTLGMAFI